MDRKTWRLEYETWREMFTNRKSPGKGGRVDRSDGSFVAVVIYILYV